MHNEILCLENSIRDTRWLRILNLNGHLVVIESSDYATIKLGYTMEFQDNNQFQTWLTDQRNSGWNLVFRDFDTSTPVDLDTLKQLHGKVFNVLNSRTGK